MNIENRNGFTWVSFPEVKRPEQPVIELDGSRYNEAVQVADILNSRNNREHFATPYQNPQEVLRAGELKDRHVLVAKEKGSVVATTTIDDSSYPINGHYLNLFAVREDKQRNGIGKEFMRNALDWAFNTTNYEGRERGAIRLAIAKGVDGWENMHKLAISVGYEEIGTLRDQMETENGAVDVVLMNMLRKDWK